MSLVKLIREMQDLAKSTRSARPLAKSDDPVGDGPTPRKQAAVETAKALTGDEYKHARKSKFQNKGEDIAHSARHKVNQWRGLAQAETSGQAEKLVKLDTMLKHDPPNISPKDGTNALKHLAAHYAISKFPKAPKIADRFKGDDASPVWHEYERDGKTFGQHASQPAPVNATLKRTWTNGEVKQRARQIYVDAYKRSKGAAEKALEVQPSPAHVVRAVQQEVMKHIHELRDGSSRYAPTVDNMLSDMLVDYHNKTLRWGHRPKTSVYGALGEFEHAFRKKYGHMGGPSASGDQNEFYNNILNHVTDVIDGKTLTKTFGLDPKEVKRFDPAEAYVAHASRTGPEYGWKDSSAHDDYLMNQAKIRGLQYGNSVTDSEREHHLKHAAHAMRDLAEILDLPHEMVSYNNRLGFAIGARGHGKALAHYEPLLRTINLTRKSGVGSLAHEWGHFFDNVLPETMGRGKHTYGSEDFPHNPHLKMDFDEGPDREEAESVRKAMHNLMHVLNNDVDSRIRKDYRSGAPWAKGMTPEKLSNYWLTGRELFARAFERHIDKKLKDAGRQNTYLAGVNAHPLWPTDEEVQKLQPLFDELFKHFKASKYLKKSMQLAKDLIPGGLADKRSPKEFDPKQLAMGIKVEMEHTNDGEKAKEIAMDHLVEDPEYYTKLKQVEKSGAKPKEVASIAIIDGDRLLMGKRNDNQRWTLPGGHLNTGETPCEGAARELAEETGIAVKPTDLVHLGTEEVTTFTGKRMIVHSFAYFGHHKTNTERDPDEEVQSWRWVDCSNGLPKSVLNMLHSPKNTTLKLLGLQNDE